MLGAQFSRDESHILTWGEDGRVRWWDVTIDDAWPRESLVLRLEVRTKTRLDQVGQVKPLPYREWLDRKRQYDQIQSDGLQPKKS